jgi:hypothetical protein
MFRYCLENGINSELGIARVGAHFGCQEKEDGGGGK